MTDNRDELSAIEILDDTLQQLRAFQARVTDAEAITHAAALALDEVPEPGVNDERRREIARAKSLLGSAAAMTRELLDEVAALIAHIEGRRTDEPTAS